MQILNISLQQQQNARQSCGPMWARYSLYRMREMQQMLTE